METDDIDRLAKLLRQLAAEGRGVPNLPRPVFESLKGIVVQTAAELLITRDGRDVLLTRREDENWSGLHLPGGFVGCGETLEQTCARVARNELQIGVRFERLLGHYAWQDRHPYASCISVLCLCRSDEVPREGDFYAHVPDGILPPHRTLLERYWFTAA